MIYPLSKSQLRLEFTNENVTAENEQGSYDLSIIKHITGMHLDKLRIQREHYIKLLSNIKESQQMEWMKPSWQKGLDIITEYMNEMKHTTNTMEKL